MLLLIKAAVVRRSGLVTNNCHASLQDLVMSQTDALVTVIWYINIGSLVVLLFNIIIALVRKMIDYDHISLPSSYSYEGPLQHNSPPNIPSLQPPTEWYIEMEERHNADVREHEMQV